MFGPKKLPELGRSLGKTLKVSRLPPLVEQEFRKAVDSVELPAGQTDATSSQTPPSLPMTPLMLLVGLGNPDPNTTVRATTWALWRLIALPQLRRGFRANAKLHGDLADIGQGDRRLRLLKPQTYMNDSGRAIRASLDWFGWTPEQLLVIVDDMDLPLGRLRLRGSGGAGGHNGLRSTIAHLGGEAFARLRIGIGAPGTNSEERKQRTVGHVLGNFHNAERSLLDQVLQEVEHGIDLIQRQGIERAGNRINSFRPDPA